MFVTIRVQICWKYGKYSYIFTPMLEPQKVGNQEINQYKNSLTGTMSAVLRTRKINKNSYLFYCFLLKEGRCSLSKLRVNFRQ